MRVVATVLVTVVVVILIPEEGVRAFAESLRTAKRYAVPSSPLLMRTFQR